MEGMTPDQLEQRLVELEATVARARAEQMMLLQMADAYQLPTADGCRNMREWVAGRLDVSRETAYALTTTARRLMDSPELSRSLAEGAVTFDRAEATSRIPAIHHDDSLRGLDIQGLRRVAARHRRRSRVDDHEAHRSQHLTFQPNLDESIWDVWGRLDGYAGPVVFKSLTEEADLIPDLPDGTRLGAGYRRAIALTRLCEDRSTGSRSTPLITVFVDKNGAETEAGTPVGDEVLDRLACTGKVETIGIHDGKPLVLGRRSRVIKPSMRRFILHRDGGCTADGCTSRYRLQIHHIVPWSEGGPTDPENLTTLCWFHHQVVVHGWGYRIDPSLGPGRIRFIAPNHDPP